MVTVKVVAESSGKPVKGKKVSLAFPGALFGDKHTPADHTNTEGEVHFNVNPGNGKVFVDGAKKYEGHISGRVVVYI